MRDGIDGRPSGLLQFYVNAFRWLGAHADALAAESLTLHPTPPSPFTTAWKSQRGIIGPRTSYSWGTSAPDDASPGQRPPAWITSSSWKISPR